MSDETDRQRLEREREERKLKKELERFGRYISDPTRVARPTSSKRHEEIQRRFHDLNAPPRVEMQMEKVADEKPAPPLPPLPFAAAWNGLENSMSVAGGYWQEGADGNWTAIPATAANTGTHVYLILKQNVDGSLKGGADAPAIVVGSELTPALLLDEDEPYHVIEARVPIAKVIGGFLHQVRHGNFTLGLWQIGGSITRWPDTVVGSLPPPPA
jgi:hypothetical protein